MDARLNSRFSASPLSKQTDGFILVSGSGTWVGKLLEADLGHELRLMVFPAVAWARRVPLPDGPDLLKLTLAQ